MNKKEIVQEILQNPKVAATVSTATAGTGIGTMFDWIPSDIGNLASLIGIILSSVLIVVHLFALFKTKQEFKKAKYETLKRELELKIIQLEVERLENENRAFTEQHEQN